MTKRLGPYNTLMNQAMTWGNKWACRRRTRMLYWSAEDAKQNFGRLYERVEAAKQLRHDVQVYIDYDGSLQFEYVERGPANLPFNWSWR